MGPTRLFHKNRSANSLLGSHEAYDQSRFQPSPVESPLQSPTFPATESRHQEIGDEDNDTLKWHAQHQRQTTPHLHRQEQPSRAQAQRIPALLTNAIPQPTIHLVGPAYSTPTSAVDDNSPDKFYRQEPEPHREDRKKRRFFGLGGSSTKDADHDVTTPKLGRSTSVRRREQPLGQESITHHELLRGARIDEQIDPGDLYISAPSRSTGQASQADRVGLRSPGLSQEAFYRDQNVVQHETQGAKSSDPAIDRFETHEASPWLRASSNVHQRALNNAHSQQESPNPAVSPLVGLSALTLGSNQVKSVDDSQNQDWHDQSASRPASQQSIDSQFVHGPQTLALNTDNTRAASSQASLLSYHTQTSMGSLLPSGQSRRPSEIQPHGPADTVRDLSYQTYVTNPQGPPSANSNAPPQYNTLLQQSQPPRSNLQYQPQPMSQPNNNEQGRSTPPPSRSRDDLSSMDVAQLMQRHDELQDKYRKVKKYYFDKDAQVQQLQNTLAHQRLAASRTSLDDNEYSNRFQRLDGAINNLAFNLRRDWRQVPSWLAPCVNRDATTLPTKEMTAVGRAAISRWLVEEIFERYFHPGIEPTFSIQLKIIERNLRRFASPTPGEEEKEALLAKISHWRLTTMDGLHESLVGAQAVEYRASLTENLMERLVGSLALMLKDPAPPGLEGGVSMIIELAIGISANLPIESRDVFVQYVLPGQLIDDSYMKLETGLPPLTNPGDGDDDNFMQSNKHGEDDGSIDSRETGNSTNNEDKDSNLLQSGQGGASSKKKGVFGNFMGNTNATTKKGGAITGSAGAPGQGLSNAQAVERKEERVRFSTFMAVEVRGRSMLIKAPVYMRD